MCVCARQCERVLHVPPLICSVPLWVHEPIMWIFLRMWGEEGGSACVHMCVCVVRDEICSLYMYNVGYAHEMLHYEKHISAGVLHVCATLHALAGALCASIWRLRACEIATLKKMRLECVHVHVHVRALSECRHVNANTSAVPPLPSAPFPPPPLQLFFFPFALMFSPPISIGSTLYI